MAPPTQHWLGPACWYSSLVLSVFAILLSSSMQWIFNTIDKSPRRPCLEKELAMILSVRRDRPGESDRPDDDEAEKGWLPKSMRVPRVDVRWNMIFTWQAPMMLMAYSVMSFFVGLTVFVCTPLYDGGGWVDGSNVGSPVRSMGGVDLTSQTAVFYLVCCGYSCLTFIWCAYWAYRFVDIDDP